MKNKLLAITLLSPIIGVAHAQSSITLYGLIDEGFEAISNAPAQRSDGSARLFRLDATNGLNSSRWGLRGSEDLGGGLQALFQLENGYELNNGKLGQGGAEFGRQAFLGLSSDRFGKLTFGRQYDSVVDFVGGLEFGDSNIGTGHSAHPADLDNFNNSRRTNSAVKFKSIDYGGLTFGGLYSFGGIAGSISRNQIYSAGASYKNGPVTVGAAYLNVRNPAASLFGSNPSDTATSNGLTGSPVFSGYATAAFYQVLGVGGSYAVGPAVFGATWSNVRFGNIAAINNASAVFNDAEVSFQYHIGPRLLAGVAYNYLHGSAATAAVGGSNYSQFAAGMNYTVSPRTDLYIAADYQTVNGRDSTGNRAVANLSGVSPSSSRYQAIGRAGIRHRF